MSRLEEGLQKESSESCWWYRSLYDYGPCANTDVVVSPPNHSLDGTGRAGAFDKGVVLPGLSAQNLVR